MSTLLGSVLADGRRYCSEACQRVHWIQGGHRWHFLPAVRVRSRARVLGRMGTHGCTCWHARAVLPPSACGCFHGCGRAAVGLGLRAAPRHSRLTSELS